MNETTTQATVEIGDIVILKTGSLEMVADEFIIDEFSGTAERVVCKWYENDEFHTAEFSIHALLKI